MGNYTFFRLEICKLQFFFCNYKLWSKKCNDKVGPNDKVPVPPTHPNMCQNMSPGAESNDKSPNSRSCVDSALQNNVLDERTQLSQFSLPKICHQEPVESSITFFPPCMGDYTFFRLEICKLHFFFVMTDYKKKSVITHLCLKLHSSRPIKNQLRNL